MNRDALCIYLKNVRDLELARYKTGQLINEWNARIRQCEKDKHGAERHDYKQNESRVGSWVVIIICIIVIIFMFYSLTEVEDLWKSWFWWFGFFVYGGVAGWLLYDVISDRKQVAEYNGWAYRQNIEIDEFNRKWQDETKKEIDACKKYVSYLKSEYNEIKMLLIEEYSLNIIPNQFRKLSAVYYIYDFMSSSPISFEQVLLHQHLEDGIQRIESKLSAIIAQNSQKIFNDRCIMEQNNQISERQNAMLSSLQRTESYASTAATYAGIAANNSKAAAYFSLATYLKD